MCSEQWPTEVKIDLEATGESPTRNITHANVMQYRQDSYYVLQ